MKLCVSSLEHTYIGVLILIPIVFFIYILAFLLVLCVDILRVTRVFSCTCYEFNLSFMFCNIHVFSCKCFRIVIIFYYKIKKKIKKKEKIKRVCVYILALFDFQKILLWLHLRLNNIS